MLLSEEYLNKTSKDFEITGGGCSTRLTALMDISQYSTKRVSADLLHEGNYVGVDNLLKNKSGKVDSSYVPVGGNLIAFEKGDVLIGNIRPYLVSAQ